MFKSRFIWHFTPASLVLLITAVAFGNIEPVNPLSDGKPTETSTAQSTLNTDQFIKLEMLAKEMVTDTSTLKADGTLVIYSRSQYYPVRPDNSWESKLLAAAEMMDLPIKKGRTYSVEGELAALDLVFASVAQDKSTPQILTNFLSAFHKDLVAKLPIFERMQYVVQSRSKMVMDVFEGLYRKEKSLLEDWKKLAKNGGTESSAFRDANGMLIIPFDSPRTADGMPVTYKEWVGSVLAFLPRTPVPPSDIETSEEIEVSESAATPETSNE